MRSLAVCVAGAVLSAACGGSTGGYAGPPRPASGAGGGAGGDVGGASGATAAMGKKVFGGTAAMLFDGPACTTEAGATGDRWCAFLARSATDTRNLFVVNVSQVAAGADVTCGSPDPGCLLLSQSLGGDSLDPTHHGTFFQGDTLVFYDGTLNAYAWRPGMTSGRLLAPASAVRDVAVCTPARAGTTVACLALPPLQPDPGLLQAELLAGKVDGPSEPLLEPVENVIVASAADGGGPSRFSFGFPPPPGDWLAWTSRATPDGPEILKVQRAYDPPSRATIASDVHGWDVSSDGSRWYWLRAVDRLGVGTLQAAPFPSGTPPHDVLADVVQYGVPPGAGSAIVAITRDATLLAIPDPTGTPAARTPIDTGVEALLPFSGRGHVAYVKHRFGAIRVDLSVARIDGAGLCAVEPTASVPFGSVRFSPDGGAVIWARTKTGGFDGFYTRLSDCRTMPIAPDVMVLDSAGERTLVLMDGFDSTTGRGTMRFRTVATGNTLAAGPPERIAGEVDSYAIAGPPATALLYTVNGGGDDDGVYVRAFAP